MKDEEEIKIHIIELETENRYLKDEMAFLKCLIERILLYKEEE